MEDEEDEENEISIIEVVDESERTRDPMATQEVEKEVAKTNRIFDEYFKEAREERERCNQNMDDMKSVLE